MKILVIRPGEDTTTVYTKYWLSKFIDQVQENNDVLDINNGNITPETIWSVINNENPDFIYHAGHGIPELTTISTTEGAKDLFWLPSDYPGHEHNDSNIQILNGRLFYFLSCYCGVKLVPAIGDIGGIGSGYEDEFVFVIDPDRYSVEEDIYANSFGDSANQFGVSITENKDLQTCLNETYDKFTSEIHAWNAWLEENPDAPAHQRIRAKLCANYLASNRDILVGSELKPVVKAANVGMLVLLLLFGIAIIYGSVKKEQLAEGKLF